MLAPAVAAVDDRHGRPLGGLGRGAFLEVADGDDVAVRLEHPEGVLERLLVEVAGPGHLGVGEAQDCAAETMHRRLGREPRPRARLVERRQQRLVLEEIAVATVAGVRTKVVGDLEHPEEVLPAEVLEGQDVPTQEAPHRGPPATAGWLTASVADPRRMPVNTTATVSVESRRPWRRSASRPARPALPVGSTSIPVVVQRDVVRLEQRAFVDDDRRAAARERAADDGEPVVGLVVEDPGRDAVRLGLPWPHERGPVVGRPGDVVGGRDVGVEPVGEAVVRPRERGDGRRLDGMDPRQRRPSRRAGAPPRDRRCTRMQARRRRPGRTAGRGWRRSWRGSWRAPSRASGHPRWRTRSRCPGR